MNNTGKSPRNNAEPKKPDTEERIAYDAMFMKFKNRPTSRMVAEVRIKACLGGGTVGSRRGRGVCEARVCSRLVSVDCCV